MAGHSKWANIKHRKGAQDAKRGKVFTKIIREVTVAARMGGEDLNSNPRLRAAMDKGLSANMPKDTLQRAIKRGVGGGDAANLEEVRYEGYAPLGVAVMVDCLTDNRNRTVGEVRHVFTKLGGNLGTDGSVAYLFNKTGIIVFEPGSDEDAIMDVALDAGAEDIIKQADGSIEVITSSDTLMDVKDALTAKNLMPVSAEVSMIASTEIPISDKESADKMLRFLDMLEDLDDVQEVYSNADIGDEFL